MKTREILKKELREACEVYMKRKDRILHPDGKFDNGGRWYPDEEEIHECCSYVRSPSRSYPLSLNQHCRTLNHVAQLFNVDSKELRKYYNEKKKEEKEQ